jgi:hypothetical protein
MATISSSVGRNGVNRPADVRLVQELLNRHKQPTRQLLKIDGVVGPRTIAEIEDFQRRVVRYARPDGRVDPGGRTLAALAGVASNAATRATYTLPVAAGGGLLTEADFQRAAEALNCEVACIKAVNEVESAGSGFLPSGRPKILFEAHIFSRRTNRQYDTTHADISSRTWNKALYKGGEREYERLERAIALDAKAALASASWGRFQIMGFNHADAGYATLETFVQAMFQSEGKQLDAFINFIRRKKLDAALREKRWADFARGYNGAGYAANQYDVKLKKAYERFSK